MKVTWSLLFIVAQGEKSHWVWTACFKVFIQSFSLNWYISFWRKERSSWSLQEGGSSNCYKTHNPLFQCSTSNDSNEEDGRFGQPKCLLKPGDLSIVTDRMTRATELSCILSKPGSWLQQQPHHTREYHCTCLSQWFTDVKKHYDHGKSLLKCI